MSTDITPDAVLLTDITPFFAHDPSIRVSLLRLDAIHPVISGNKWFKLKHNLGAAVAAGFRRIITFGGAYSNHLAATAAAAKAAGLTAIGVVRGLHAQAQLTPTLAACRGQGMVLHFVSRQDYARKEEPAFLAGLTTQFGPAFVIPEGGDNEWGRAGAGDIAALIPGTATDVCLPVGTGTTLTGIRNALPADRRITGFTAMNQGDYLAPRISACLPAPQNASWQLQTAYAFGGFAKTSPVLLEYMRRFYQATHIPLDIVYTGKMMYGVEALLQQGFFSPAAHVVCIHTGGLQGNPPGLFGA